jgi:hypothetical protein
MADLKEWMARRAQEDERLYQRYGEPLEAAHQGEYVAIGSDGQTILGKSDVEVLKQAIDTFGSGNFAFKRIGQRTFGRWLKLCP